MRTIIRKTDKPGVWEWIVFDTGYAIGHGYTKTKKAAENDSRIWLEERDARQAREAGRVVKGDKLEIKPEWQDPGDQDFQFYATETQLKGMREIHMRAVHKITGEPGIGTQAIQCDMLASHQPA